MKRWDFCNFLFGGLTWFPLTLPLVEQHPQVALYQHHVQWPSHRCQSKLGMPFGKLWFITIQIPGFLLFHLPEGKAAKASGLEKLAWWDDLLNKRQLARICSILIALVWTWRQGVHWWPLLLFAAWHAAFPPVCFCWVQRWVVAGRPTMPFAGHPTYEP